MGLESISPDMHLPIEKHVTHIFQAPRPVQVGAHESNLVSGVSVTVQVYDQGSVSLHGRQFVGACLTRTLGVSCRNETFAPSNQPHKSTVLGGIVDSATAGQSRAFRFEQSAVGCSVNTLCKLVHIGQFSHCGEIVSPVVPVASQLQ